MTCRYLAVAGLLGAVLALSPVSAVAQTEDVPRTAWGAPDFGGVWDYRSATPMARPEEFKDKPVLTEEEAAEVAREREAWFESLDSGESGGVAGNAIHTRVFLDFGFDPVPDRRTSLIIDPPDGRHPPAVDGAAEKRAAVAGSFGAGPFDSWEDLNLMDRCIGTIGFPIVPGPYNNNIQIFQTPDHVAILAESMHFVRIIPLEEQPRSGLAQFGGDGRGRWEGDTLVVESMNFDGELTMIGTEPRRLVERFTREGDIIQYEFTVEDPGMWEAPWTARVPLRKTDGPLFEYACHEGNYGLVNILSAARAEERAAATPSGAAGVSR